MAFVTLTAKLTADIKDFSTKMDTAMKQAGKVTSTLGSGVGSKGSNMLTFATNLSDKYKEASKELRSHNLGLKDTSRIVQGIMVSQAFYAAVGAIRSATSALWDYNVALDYMKVTYSALFGSTKLAEDFMSVLQAHSIETIFDYQGLADASKKLLAYGIEYKNLMFIMEGLTDLGAMSGDAAALDRIALALGQIYTKGKLSAEEMRQLANAYIPITNILQDKFGLTGDDLKRVGDLNLPAADVINAIVDYANENFGDVGDAAMLTITGLQNRIVDTLKVTGAAMLQPLTSVYKSFLAYISDGLDSIRSAYETGGMGGIFEYLVPDESSQRVIRQFLANVHNLFTSLASVGVVAGKVFGNVAQVVANAFNIVSPIIIGFVNTLAMVINRFLSTEFGATTLRIALIGAAAAFVLLKAQAIGALVITAVTKAVTGLSKALVLLGAIITKHPIVALLVTLAAVLLGVTVSSNRANSSLSGLFDTISGATGGTSSADIFKETEKEINKNADAADQFNNRLEESTEKTEAFKDALKGVNATAKKTGGLLSFDEVFKLPDPSGSGSGAGSIGSTVLDDIDALNKGLSNLGGALIPEIPDFSTFASDFADSLFGGLETALSDKVKNIATGAGIGGILGLVIGAIFKNPKLGMWIGTAVGGFATFLWQELEGAMSNTGISGAAGIWHAIGSAIAKAGAGTGLGTMLKNAFTQGGLKGLWNALAGAIKTTGLKNIVKGGLIGMAIGAITDSIAHLLWTDLADKIEGANVEAAKVGQTIGSVIVGIIGGLLGGPVGAVIGSAIGTFAGGFFGLISDNYKGWARDTASLIEDWAISTSADIYNWIYDTGSSIEKWWSDTWAGYDKWARDTSATLENWATEAGIAIATWTANAYADISAWVSNTYADISAWWANVKSGYDNWARNTASTLENWATEAGIAIATWTANAYADISAWWANVKSGYDNWARNTASIIEGWFITTKESIRTWWNNLFDPNTWKSGWDSVKTWFKSLFDNIKNWFSNLRDNISSWWDSLWSGKSVEAKVDGNRVSVSSYASGGSTLPSTPYAPGAYLQGHAVGGVFNREHIARFAEGNKAEAIIPLENRGAMQPFVDAVSSGIISSLAPIVANINAGGHSNLPPLYVGTLIADDRGLRELYKKFEVIQLQENDRRGLNATV